MLDLCAGEGGGATYMAQEHGAKVVGYELAQTAVDQADKKVQARGLAGQVEIRAESISRIQAVLFDRVHDALKDGGAFVLRRTRRA